MDIQSILSQVLSLSELVIKNPSTSIKNSGFDLSTITSIAGSLLGGGKEGGASGGLGSILGAAAATGALNSVLGGKGGSAAGGLGSILGGLASAATGAKLTKQSEPDTPQGKEQSSGGLGSILGGLATAAAGAALSGKASQSAGNTGGGITDILSKITSNSSIIKNMLSGSNASKYNAEEKSNLSDMLNILNTAKGFLGK